MYEDKLLIKTYDNAYIKPVNGAYDSDGIFIPKSFKRIYGQSEWFEPSDMTADEMQGSVFENSTVLFLGYIRQHYGHFLVDSCSRMWALTDLVKISNYKICCTTAEGRLFDFVENFFEGLGIIPSLVEVITEPKQFAHVMIPELSFVPMKEMNNQYWIRAFDCVIAKWNSNENTENRSKKLYLSQTRYKVGNRYGERLIEYVFKKNGYEIVYPETLNLKEQIILYNNAEEIVCTNGTLAHNAVWMNPNSKMVVLKRFCEKETNPHQVYIFKARGIAYEEINACWRLSKHDLGCMKITSELKKWFIEKKFKYHVIQPSYYADVVMFTYKYLKCETKKQIRKLF